MTRLLLTTIAILLTASVSAADYNILDFGAKADTTALSTQAIQQAIDKCSAQGGGRVVIPA